MITEDELEVMANEMIEQQRKIKEENSDERK